MVYIPNSLNLFRKFSVMAFITLTKQLQSVPHNMIQRVNIFFNHLAVSNKSRMQNLTFTNGFTIFPTEASYSTTSPLKKKTDSLQDIENTCVIFQKNYVLYKAFRRLCKTRFANCKSLLTIPLKCKHRSTQGRVEKSLQNQCPVSYPPQNKNNATKPEGDT